MVHQAIHEQLKQVAKQRATTTYGKVAPLAELDMSVQEDRYRIGQILDEINEYEVGQGHPMLSVIVVRADPPRPGQGFFDCARRLGCYGGNSESDALEFFVKELNAVHDFWASH